MIVLDANILIYAADQQSTRHRIVLNWMQQELNAGELFGVSWCSLLAFVRICTLPSILARPLTLDQALEFLDALLADPETCVIVDSGAQHYLGFSRLLRNAGVAGNLSNDAHIAAVALANGGRLASFDRDFAQFEGIQLIVPA
ncbi:MAG: TA system VapC family ribonuclease toxin [Lysobacterales bacterium]